jgi:hypothetical protein
MKRILLFFLSAWLIAGTGTAQTSPDWLQQLPVIRELPDPFLMNNGKRVASEGDWQKRRQELKELIQKYEYGHFDPPSPVKVSGTSPDSVIVTGKLKIIRRTVKLLTGIKGEIAFSVNLYIPGSGEGPFPVVITGDLCWSTVIKRVGLEELVSLANRGYIIAEFDRTIFAPDKNLRKEEPGWENKYYDHGAILKWAWGFHRTIDYLVTLPVVDKSKIVVTGWSRGGKAALVAGAFDERIAITAPNCSGTSGSGPQRFVQEGAETTEIIAGTRFPFWFCSNFRYFFGENRDRLPFDQHSLIALVAPRAYLCTNGLKDTWANPIGTAQAHLAAREVFTALGVRDKMGIFYANTGHDHKTDKWEALLDFADKVFYGKTPVYNFENIPFDNLEKAYSWAAPALGFVPANNKFNIPEKYLKEPASIPPFWITDLGDFEQFLINNVKKGKVEIIGYSAGGRPIKALFYGTPRQGNGTTTFSGSLGFGNIKVFRGPDNNMTVYLGMAGVHGGEFEGMMGMINLINIMETGSDLRGKKWPEITEAVSKIDRIILIPFMNPDGRARIPLKMEAYQGTSANANDMHEFLNTGGKPDGTNIGWPQVKEFIPIDFSKTGFPGGYPNDNGVNIQHDDFLGKKQPETQALFDLVVREKPDLIINMHTGAPPGNYFIRMHRPFCETFLKTTFDSLYYSVHKGLTINGLQDTKDVSKETNPADSPQGVYNLDGALNLHCGALSVVVEAPSHSFSGTNRTGKPVVQSPDMIVDAELMVHQEALKFLLRSGGRSKWTSGTKK